MKTTVALTSVFALLAGCAVMVPAHLYPVRGPLAQQSNPPTYSGTLNGSFLPHGTFTVHLAAAVSCRGDWSAVPAEDPTARQMSAAWDEVYGSGFFVANVLGRRTFARGTLTCTDARILHLEFLVVEPGKQDSTIGVVGDDGGNIFKLTV